MSPLTYFRLYVYPFPLPHRTSPTRMLKRRRSLRPNPRDQILVTLQFYPRRRFRRIQNRQLRPLPQLPNKPRPFQ